MKQNKTVKFIIITLTVLLAVSLAALCGRALYCQLSGRPVMTVTVPDNLITSDREKSIGTGDGVSENASKAIEGDISPQTGTTGLGESKGASATPGSVTLVRTKSTANNGEEKAISIVLSKKQPQDNTAFQVGNMFPGDQETKYFCVSVAYHDRITVHYKATVRPGYEKLSEVLKIRVTLLTSGEILYNGPIREMPQSLPHRLASSGPTTDELYYEVTAYLDSSVGNEYQNRDLIADFTWWVEETGNLDNAPNTGDTTAILWWAVLAAISGCGLILLLAKRRRKEAGTNG